MDPVLLVVIGAVAAVSTLFWALAAVLVWTWSKRRPLITGGLAAASALTVIGSMSLMPPGYSQSERERIEQLHAQFAPALERYRQTHGDYPPTLEAAGIATPLTRYGPLEYEVRREKDGTPVYSVGYGDYITNGFSAWWSSDKRKWFVDS